MTDSDVLPSMKSGMVKGGWLVVGLLFIAGGLNYIDRTMLTTMRVSLLEAMPMSEARFGLLTSVFLWVYGICSPLAGFVADKFPRSKVIAISLLSWSVVTWLTAYSTTFGQLLVSRVFLGITEAFYIPASLALIVDYHRTTTRSLASGVHEAGIFVGSSLSFLGGWIAERYEWSTAFWIFGVFGVAYSFMLFIILRDVPGNRQVSQESGRVSFFPAVKDLFSNGAFLLMLGYWGLMGIVGWMVVGWLPTFYREQFSLSQGLAGLYATAYLYPASIAGLLLGGFWADRWSRKTPMSRIYVPVIGLLIAAPGIFLASYVTLLPLAIAFFMIYSVTRVFGDANAMPIVCMITDPRYRATAFGILNFFSCIIGGLGLYAGGVLRDASINLSNMYQFSAFIMIICAALLFMIRPRQKT
jgi:MFS family permease